MNIVEFARLLAIMDKIEIENNPNLSKEEKEFWKQAVDKIKNQVEKGNQSNPV